MADALADQGRLAPDATWWGDAEIARSGLGLSRRAALEPVIGGITTNSDIRLGQALQPVPIAVWRF